MMLPPTFFARQAGQHFGHVAAAPADDHGAEVLGDAQVLLERALARSDRSAGHALYGSSITYRQVPSD